MVHLTLVVAPEECRIVGLGLLREEAERLSQRVARRHVEEEIGITVVLEDYLDRLHIPNLLAEQRVARQLRHAAVPT